MSDLIINDHRNDEEEDDTPVGHADIVNNQDPSNIASVNNNNNNNNNNPNDGVPELDIASACANVDITVEEDIDLNDLTKHYNQSHESIPAFLSPMFSHRVTDTKFVVRFLGKPSGKPAVFYLKSKIMQGVLTKFAGALQARGIRPTRGNFIANITTIGQRNQPHDETSKFKRSGSGRRIDLIMYTTHYPGDMTYDAIIQDQVQIGNVMLKGVFGDRTRMSNIGKVILTNGTENGGGLTQWLIDNKGGIEKSRDVAACNLVNEVTDYFADGLTWRHNVHLDHLMVDYDIKQFLLHHVGCTSWDSLSDAEKANCYKNFPSKTLPNWDTLMSEGY